MNKRRFICLLVCMIVGCSDSPEPHTVKAAGLRELSGSFGLHLTIDTKSLTVSPWDIRYHALQSDDDPALLKYLPLFEQEFGKIPSEILALSGLQTVVFVRDLAIGEQPRAAVPDYDHEALYYDVGAPGENYIRHVLHHEFYHMLEQQLYGDAYYKDPLWQQLNPPEFSYGHGGAFARGSAVSAFVHPRSGFINGYAMSGLEEDKAEIWSVLWSEQSWRSVQDFVASDSLLQQKIRLLTAQLQCRAPALHPLWPEYARQYVAAPALAEVLCTRLDPFPLPAPAGITG